MVMKKLLWLVLCAGPLAVAPAPAAAAAASSAGETNTLRLHFRGAPLETVLDYLSETAGFAIVLEAQVMGHLDVWSDEPLSPAAAVRVLNSALAEHGLIALRKGRILTIARKDEVKTRGLPVRLGGDPAAMPDGEEWVTQIIPVRNGEAAALLNDLQPLVSSQTALTANESANTLTITDTEANVRRVAEIVQALDAGAEEVMAVRVFTLKYADPVETADLLTQLFPDESRSTRGGSAGPFREFGGGFPGGPPGLGGPMGGPPGSGGFVGGPPGPGGGSEDSAGSSQRLSRQTRVIAVADARTRSIVVTAAQGLLTQVERVVAELDSNPARKQTVQIYRLKNASALEVADVLGDLFNKSGTASSRADSTRTDPLEERRTAQSQQSVSGAASGFSPGAGGQTGGSGATGGSRGSQAF